jgi:predicted HicB family RNase H-like nuclease
MGGDSAPWLTLHGTVHEVHLVHQASLGSVRDDDLDGKEATMSAAIMTVLHYDIDEALHRKAKMRAAARGVTLRAWVLEAIEEKISAEEAGEAPEAEKQAL